MQDGGERIATTGTKRKLASGLEGRRWAGEMSQVEETNESCEDDCGRQGSGCWEDEGDPRCLWRLGVDGCRRRNGQVEASRS